MKKLLKVFLLALCFMTVLPTAAYADVAAGPIYAVAVGVPVLLIAVAIIVIAVLIHVIRKSRNK